MTLEWRDPGPVRKGSRVSKYDELADELRDNPGRWAMVGTAENHNRSTAIGNGLIRRGCEITRRRRDDGLIEVFGRWPK